MNYFIKNIVGKAALLPTFLFLVTILFVQMRTLDGYLVLLTSVCIFFMVPIRRYYDNQSIILIFFSFLYVLISGFNGALPGNTYIIGILVCPFLFYLFGKYLFYTTLSENQLIRLLLVISVLLLLYTLYYTILDIRLVGIINVHRHLNFQDLGDGVSATLNGIISSWGLGGAGFLFFMRQKTDKKLSVSLVLVTLCALLINVHLVNRTAIVALILIMLIGIFYSYKQNIIKTILFLLFFVVLFLIFKEFHIVDNDILSAYANRNDGEGEISGGGGRFERWTIALSNIFIHPLGFVELTQETGYYAHNLWLDTARVSGVIPLVLLLIFTIKAIRSSILIIKHSSAAVGYYLLSLYYCSFVYCMCEPVMDAIPLFFYLFCLISGILNSYSDEIRYLR